MLVVVRVIVTSGPDDRSWLMTAIYNAVTLWWSSLHWWRWYTRTVVTHIAVQVVIVVLVMVLFVVSVGVIGPWYLVLGTYDGHGSCD